MNANGLPSITWATGPNGPPSSSGPTPNPALPTGTQPASPGIPTPPPSAPPPGGPRTTSPAAFYAPAAANVAEDAIAAGFGPGSERLRGFLDNTFIFELLRDEL